MPRCGKCWCVINLCDAHVSFHGAPVELECWLSRCGAANSCSVCPRISPVPWECALQLWPVLQGVLLGCDLFNYNPHHCTVTWSGGYQCNQDIGTFPDGHTSSTYFFFQAPNFPSFHSALGRPSVCYTSWGQRNSQMPAEMEDNLCL